MLSSTDWRRLLSVKRRCSDRGGKPVDTSFRAARNSGVNLRVQCGVSVMVAKPFVMMVVAALIGPAVGVGLFILMNNF